MLLGDTVQPKAGRAGKEAVMGGAALAPGDQAANIGPEQPL